MNEETIALYRDKVAKMERKELEEVAALALYHLQCMVGSRNSFLVRNHFLAPVWPERSFAVNQMHAAAVTFSIHHSV